MIETNFKHTDIGLIPHDWEVKSLDSLFAFYAGGDIQKEYFSMTPQENKRYPIYSNSLENKGLYGYTSNPRYEANSITITGRGSLGHAEFRNHKFDAIVRLLVLQPKELVSGEFITNTINFYMPFVFESTGVPQLTVPQTAKALIPLPPTLAEQEKIADALSKMDQLVNDLGALIEKKKAIKQGTMQDLLTAKRRLKGFTGEWNSVKLGDMCYFGKGKGLKKEYLTDNGRYKCILYGEIFTKYDSIIKSVVSRTNIEEGTYSQKGDVLMPGSTTTLGIDLVKAVVINENDVLLGGDVIILRPKENQISSEFLAYLISNIDRNKVADVTQGITIIHLHAKNMTDIAYLIPPTLAEQNAIANILSSMDTEITNLEQKRDKYIAIKQGMMQNLLTGKIRLI